MNLEGVAAPRNRPPLPSSLLLSSLELSDTQVYEPSPFLPYSTLPYPTPACLMCVDGMNIERISSLRKRVFKAHGLLYHSTLGWRVIKKKKRSKRDQSARTQPPYDHGRQPYGR